MEIHTDDVARTATNGDGSTKGGLLREGGRNGTSAVGNSGRGERTGYTNDEVVILLVTNRKEDKRQLADAIKDGDPSSSWSEERPVGNVRIHSHQHPPRKIVEPMLLDYVSGKSATAIARKWISQNSLRKLIIGKLVIVVCVITLSILEAPCFSSVFGYDKCWVDVLSIIFRDQKPAILFVVKHDRELDGSQRKKMTTFIRNHKFNARNIIWTGFGKEVRKVLEQNIGMSTNCSSTSGSIKVCPLARAERSSKRKKYTAWSPERVMLFGLAGSGKSTLAQMLTKGKIDPRSNATFSVSSSIRGHTKIIERGDGRGWYVVDTPGFGEPSEGGTVSTEEVQRKVKKFVDLIDGTFAHFLFVMQKGRVNQLEVNLWKFFKLLFGEDIGANFTIVISGAEERWLEEELAHLQKSFDGCSSFLCVDFPTIDGSVVIENEVEKEELQKENEEIQQESLQYLEEELAKLGRCDRVCEYGKGSRTSKAIERDRANSDMDVERSLRTRMIVEGTEILFGVDELVSNLIHRLTVNDRIVLEPLVL